MNNNNNKNLTNTEEGFTLIEVLISIVVLAIGLLSLNAMQMTAMNGNAGAVRLTGGVNWASDRVETLLNLPYNDTLLDSGTHDPENDGADNDSDGTTDEDDEDGVVGYQVEWTVQDDTPLAGSKTITVTVNRNFRGVARHVTFENIRSSAF